MTGGASLETAAALAGADHGVWDLVDGAVIAGHWPRRDFTEFCPVPAAVPCARRHTLRVLAGWGLGRVCEQAELCDQAELVVSELVTNAIAASQAVRTNDPVRLWLLTDGARVGIAVWDANHHMPMLAEPDELAENGRGLLLVATLAGHWDAQATPRLGGKIVRAICTPGPA